jgi:hypothetical protein
VSYLPFEREKSTYRLKGLEEENQRKVPSFRRLNSMLFEEGRKNHPEDEIGLFPFAFVIRRKFCLSPVL